MTNTTNNVPRELLERCCKRMYDMMQGDLHEELRAILSAPSPAGVDGLEVVGIQWLDTGHYRKKPPKYGFNPYDWNELCRLSDAEAIIDGLRGEVESGRRSFEIATGSVRALIAERDQHAQRIGELEGLLREAREFAAAYVSNSFFGHNARKTLARIDAALSAGKEGE